MGHEKTLTALAVALAGASYVYGAGMTESGVTFDPAVLVMDDEWIAMIRHFLGGIAVTRDTLGGADIAAVGPFGDFLSLPSTYAHMREQSTAARHGPPGARGVGVGRRDRHVRARPTPGVRDPREPRARTAIDEEVKQRMRAVVERADRERGS